MLLPPPTADGLLFPALTSAFVCANPKWAWGPGKTMVINNTVNRKKNKWGSCLKKGGWVLYGSQTSWWSSAPDKTEQGKSPVPRSSWALCKDCFWPRFNSVPVCTCQQLLFLFHMWSILPWTSQCSLPHQGRVTQLTVSSPVEMQNI